MELIIINIVESILMTLFMTYLLTINKNKYLCRIILILSNFAVITAVNYIDFENLFLTTFLIFMNTSILKLFSKQSWYEILFVVCLESLYLSFTGAISMILRYTIENFPVVVFSKVLYAALMPLVIILIKKRELYFNKTLYLILSLIIIFLQFLINNMVIVFNYIYEGYNDIIISFVLLLCATVLMLYMILLTSDFSKKEQRYYMLKTDKENEEVLKYLYNELKIMKHDFKHDLNLIEYQLVNEKYNELREYIKDKKDIIHKIPVLIHSKNELINTIINNKIFYMHVKNITFNSIINVDETLNINEYDLNDLLSNMLDNAIENTYEKGTVQLKLIQDRQILNISIENSIIEVSDLKTKKDNRNHGFGLNSIEKIANKYHGKIDITQKDNKFIITCTLLLI